MWGCSLAAVRLFSGCGDIDMYDKTLVAHLLPPEMIIKNFIHGDPDCNYEKYLLSFQVVIDVQSRFCHTYQYLHSPQTKEKPQGTHPHG